MRELPEEDMNSVDVSAEQSNWMGCFRCNILERQEIVRHLRWTGHFAGSLQAQDEQIQDETIVLRDERRELKTSNNAITVCVVHVFVGDDNVVLGCHVISDVVINDET